MAQSRLKPMLFLLQALICWNDSCGLQHPAQKAVTSITLIYFVNMSMIQRLEQVGPVLPPFGVPWIKLRLSGLSLRCLPGPKLPRLVDGILVFWLISM